MQPDAAGASPARRPARPANKRTNPEGLDAATIRRAVDGITAVTGCRRKAAREQVRAWVAGGQPMPDLEAWLRANYRVDPTGVTAVRNVAGGGRHG